jgi:hypothetical protein
MMTRALLALSLQQSSVPLVPPPSPPAMQADDAAAQRYAESLRRSCLSERGVSVVIASWRRWMADSVGRVAFQKRVLEELGQAAASNPVDVDRLDRALAARRKEQADWFIAEDAQSIEVMRGLSPLDRLIFAQRLTIYKPAIPPRTCSGPTAR